VAVGALAAGTARAAYAGLRRRPPAGEKTWTRTNHRGEIVTLLEGPAASAGAITAELIAAALARSRPSRVMSLAGAGALAFGLIDDLAGSGKRRGLRGHLGALAHGEVTTGTVKLGGIAATGFAAAAPGSLPDVVINAGLIAGGANLLNLFDLRPGRAIKVAVLSGGLIAAGSAVTGGRSAGLAAVAAPLGAALALLPEDLGERAMLGDAGANALGAMLGAAAARSLPRPARIGLLAGMVALTLVSEKVSFTAFIERTPALRTLDMLGRRPVQGAGTAQSGRQRMGRHRRGASGVGGVRSSPRFFRFFVKKPARQEP
jgi:UDP-GlcNAc:undecaprenyl-phosphate GlcNAc-1-phosphate transferase